MSNQALPPPPPPPPPPDRPEGSSTDAPTDGHTTDAPSDDADAARERALRHATEATRTYPCHACGGELEFDIGDQLLTCPHCGNQQELIEDEDGAVEEQDLRRAMAALRAGAVDRSQPQLAEEKEIVCQNCGGHTTFNGSLTATRCPYCTTPIQRDDVHDAPERLAVDGIVPFQVDEPAARQAIDRWTKSRWFAPKEFKKYSRTGAFSSVYMAYFTYDAETTTNYTGRRGDYVTRGSGEDRRREIRWRNASGRVHNSFDDIVVHANEGLNRDHVSALEPWPTQQAQPFSAEYVAGHLCRTYDRDVEQCFGDAKEVINEGVTRTIRRDIGGDQQRILRRKTDYGALSFKHLLLPLWLLTVIFGGQTFQVMINGVTGEVKGERPWSRVKILLAVLVALMVIAVIAGIYVASGGGG